MACRKRTARVTPDPAAVPTLGRKLKELDAPPIAWPEEAIAATTAPTCIVLGDANVVRPEHGVELVEVLGGVPGDLAGVPAARLANLPRRWPTD